LNALEQGSEPGRHFRPVEADDEQLPDPAVTLPFVCLRCDPPSVGLSVLCG
jgi:hypothetical protein